jgi:general secretion pathway protein F
MTVVSTGILSFLMSFVVPKIARIFENTGNTLPVPTRVLLATSNVMRDWWWAMLAVTFLAIWQIRRSYGRNRIKYDAMLLRVPLVGRLILELSMARFSRTLGLLLEGGIPIVRAIGFASRSMGNLHLRGKAEYLAERLTEGAALAAAMREAGVFPATLTTLVSTGERSGRLAEILLDAGDAFERDFDKGVTRAVSVFEPAMIVGMGLTVGLIVVSILLPIFRMSQMVK